MPLPISICIVLAHRHRPATGRRSSAYPKGAQQLHRRQRQPRVERWARGRRGAPHRLHADRRRVGLGRRGRDHIGHPRALRPSACSSASAIVRCSCSATCAASASPGTIFMAPTYAYIVVILAIIGYRRGRQTALGDAPGLRAAALVAEIGKAPARCWASSSSCARSAQGAVALTGVEAISRRRAGLQAAGVEERAHHADLGGAVFADPLPGHRLPGRRRSGSCPTRARSRRC